MNFSTNLGNQALQRDSSSLLGNQFPKCYPFIKWAGGKSQLLREISKSIPSSFDRYFEPFLGGGAVFFHLTSKENRRVTAFLSDTNQELINTYKMVKESVEELIQILRFHEKEYYKGRQEYYYKLRTSMPISYLERAARFITLNKTCFNGLYRVNSKGIFNVPIGRYKNPLICDAQNLRNVSLILRKSDTKLTVSDYKDLLSESASEGDFVYLDPPYSPVSSTANFTGYTNTGFGNEDQLQLALTFKKLHERGCKILLSNSDTPAVRKLYIGFPSTVIKANRAINSKASKRTGHTELLIRNF